MAIQLQKYNGNNTLNNEVTINCENKSVKFKPIVENFNIKRSYVAQAFLGVLLPCMIISFIFWYFVYGTPIQELSLYARDLPSLINYTSTVFTPILVCFLILPFLIIQIELQFKNKKWRHEMFPKMNVSNHRWIIGMFTLGMFTTSQKVYKNQLGNTKIYKGFKNMLLDYKAYGDYHTYLKKIEIRSQQGTKNLCDWYMLFTFTKEPKKGRLIIKYI